MAETIAKVEDLQEIQTALKELSKTLNDIDGNIALALQRVHNEWKDEMFNDFKEMYDTYKQRVVEIAKEYKEFADGWLQKRIDDLNVIEKKS